MQYVEIIMMILGGMGTFLIGMKILSENLTRLAHSKLKSLLNKTSNNRFAGVGIGAVVTIIGQSSAFTTVMVVGLVNAGIMTLFQATSIIMGANIGTTLTAWVLSLGNFDFTMFFLCLAAVGIFMTMFSKTDKIKSVGFALAALGLIFVGLEFMSGAFDRQKYPEIFDSIKSLFSKISNPLLLLFIGIAVTALVQSSTAVTAIVLEMSLAGLAVGDGGNAVYYIIIGSNIGTCVTALISSLGASPNAKRAAIIHFLFNFFGALIFTVVLVLWKGFANTVLVTLFPSNPAMQIAMFHTLFNVICTLVFLPFISIFVKLANLMVREKNLPETAEAKPGIVSDLDERLLRSPSVALGHLYQETGKMFSFAVDTLGIALEAFLNKDESEKEKVTAQNRELAEANKKTVEYLVKISASSLVFSEEITVSSLHYVLNDIMRIGELADNVTKYTAHYVRDELVFSAEFLEMTKNMFEKIRNLYVLSLATFLYNDFARLAEVDALEDEIDQDRRAIVNTHIMRLNEGKCQPQNSSVFINLVGNLERAADHITFIAHSIERNERK